MAAGEKKDSSLLNIGVCVASEETWSLEDRNTYNTYLGFVIVNVSTLKSSANELRQILHSQLASLPPNYGFFTKEGWPVANHQESLISLESLVSPDHVIRIQPSFDRPRIGVFTVDGAGIGFVFLSYISTLGQLRSAIAKQIGTSLPTPRDYFFLDRNSWPVTHDQERHLCVLDLLHGSTVHISSKRSLFRLHLADGLSGHRDNSLQATPPPHKRSPSPSHSSLAYLAPSPDNSHVHGGGHSQESLEAMDRLLEGKDAQLVATTPRQEPKQVLISYVRAEAAQHALLLKKQLELVGYSVYLDVHEITCGLDWQDSLNFAVSNCEVFVPLVTQRYGETQWTNREVKLADVLNKLLLPVSFLDHWPPRCLAIQFATTQFIPWKSGGVIDDDGSGKWTAGQAAQVAQQISLQLKQGAETEVFSQASNGSSLKRKGSVVRSYANLLPEGVVDAAATSQQREGKPLVVISVHPKQKDYGQHLKAIFELEGYEVWNTTEMQEADNRDLDDAGSSQNDTQPFSSLTQYSQSTVAEESRGQRLFQQKVDEAGVILFVLSKAYSQSRMCQKQVYYCEHRKRVIPLTYEDFAMPGWMSMLIGTSTFEDHRREGYLESLKARVQRSLNPLSYQHYDEDKQEAQISHCVNFIQRSLEYKKSVYISGATKFFCKKSEAICKAIGVSLARQLAVSIVTGGFYGVGETVARSFLKERERLKLPPDTWHILPERDEQDRSMQTTQNKDRTFRPLPFGKTIFTGESVRQRETTVARVFEISILIEGGPGAAHEAEQFAWNDHIVIPVKCTGGAAGGKFNVPQKIFELPPGALTDDWSLLASEEASPESLGEAVSRIVLAVQDKLGKHVGPPVIADRMPRLGCMKTC